MGADRTDSAPSEPQPLLAPPVVSSPDADVVAEYTRAFTASHAGRVPARSLVLDIAREARRLRL
jgi:hypothetical protein